MSAGTPGRSTTDTSARGPDLRQWGRRLIAASALASATLPWAADWNRRHTFGPEYGPHARWHGTSEVVSATLDGLVALWLLRNGERDDSGSERDVTAAALLPIARWAPFNLTLLLPGTSPYDQHRLPQRVLGMPAALLAQDLIAATAATGLLLHRRGRRTGQVG
jgi:hypothetical protein